MLAISSSGTHSLLEDGWCPKNLTPYLFPSELPAKIYHTCLSQCCAKELAASQTCLLDAQQKAGMAREAQQRELEVLRQQHQEFEGQIRCLEDEKQKLGSKQEAQRHLAADAVELRGKMSRFA